MSNPEPEASANRAERTDILAESDDRMTVRRSGTNAASPEAPDVLHGPVQGRRLGRYILLERLGQGAMGQVYLAYDPDLARQVAVKVLRRRVSGGGEETRDPKRRFLREAQAAAQLVDPHVVAVYEAGVDDGTPFIAMEYVRGTTLKAVIHERGSASARSWREVLDLFVQAGEGLAAAHAVDILHRDFKPDNVLIDARGQAKVADFGLASRASASGTLVESQDVEDFASTDGLDAKLTSTGSVMGTPAYMPPEQHRSSRVDARADVYAFCASLWEGLYGERPFGGDTLRKIYRAKMDGAPSLPSHRSGVPRWLGELLRRGLEPDPKRRPPTMRALLDAIERGHQRRVRGIWIAVAASVGLVAAGGVGLQRLERAQRVAACEASGAEIEQSWTPAVNSAFAAGMRASVDVDGTLERVRPWLDRYVARWSELRTQTCLAARVDRDPVWTEPLVARSDFCFEDRRIEFEGLIDALSGADESMVTYAVTAAAGLSDLASCTDPLAMRQLPLPDDQNAAELMAVRTSLSRIDALDAVAAYDEAWEVATALEAQVEVLDWAPLTAALRNRIGELLIRRSEYEEAESTLEAAYFEALDAEALIEAMSAAEQLSFLLAEYRGRAEDGLRWSKHAEALLARISDPNELHRAYHLNNRAVIEEFLRDFDASVAHHRESIAIRERELGEGHPDVARGLSNLAAALRWRGDEKEAFGLYEQSIEIKERSLGPRHPSVAMSLNNYGILLQEAKRYDEAEQALARALEIREHVYGPKHSQVASGLNNLAIIHMKRDRLNQAAAAYRRSVDIWRSIEPGAHAEMVTNLSNLGYVYLQDEKFDDAQAAFEEALAVADEVLEPDDPMRGYPLGGLGTLANEREDYEVAEELLQRALGLRRKAYGDDHIMVASTLNLVGSNRVDGGALDRAREAYLESLKILEASSGASDERLQSPLQGLAELELEAGRVEPAQTYARRLVDLDRQGDGAKFEKAEAQFLRSKTLAAANGTQAARDLAESARKVLSASEDDDHQALAKEIRAWLATL